jgi:hypothetical protein
VNEDTKQPNKDKIYEWYEKTRKEFREDEVEQQKSLDKQLLILSSAVLGFSILVGEKFANLDEIVFKIFIIITWIMLGTTVISTVWSFSCGSRAARDYSAQFDQNFKTEKYKILTSKWIPLTDFFNNCAIGSFTIGIICLLVFSTLGLLNPRPSKELLNMSNDRIIVEGRKPQQPATQPTTKGVTPLQPSKLPSAEPSSTPNKDTSLPKNTKK